MYNHLNTVALKPRLWIATVLLFVLSVAFVAQFFDKVSYFDNAAPVRFIKVSESSSEDGESPSSASPEPVALPVSYAIVCAITFALVVLPRRHLTALRPVLIYHLPSRAPPHSLPV